MGEQLEQRALLAVTVGTTYDWNFDAGASTAPTATAAGVNAYTNQDKYVLTVTIDSTDDDQSVYMRVVNGNYIFATDPNFSNVKATVVSNLSWIYSLPTSTAWTDANNVTTPAVYTTYVAAFDTIYVKLDSNSVWTDGDDKPSFTVVGASQDVTKTLIVDLVDRSGAAPQWLGGSAISVGAPVKVSASTSDGFVGGYQPALPYLVDRSGSAANTNNVPLGSPVFPTSGGIYLSSESIAINAAMASQRDAQLNSVISESSAGMATSPSISINAPVSVPGQASVTAEGVNFNVNSGGAIGNGAGSAGSFTLDLQDADARIAGKISANNLSFFLQPSLLGLAATARSITTRATTGAQSGMISGDELLVYLANQAAFPPDGTVDLQTSVNTLRITSSATTIADTLDYGITIANSKALVVDAVAASKGDIAISTAAGTIDLQAAIDTLGSFNLSSAADLVVDTAISSTKNISLTSTAGSVTTAAAIEASEVGTALGRVTITAKNDVTINSLVKSAFDGVIVTATTGKIQSGANLASDPTSRITSPSATLKAATGITLGTNVGFVTATVTGAGVLAIDDNRDDVTQLTVSAASTTNGNVTIKAVQDVAVSSLIAGGSGDATVTSTGGDISLAGTVIADGNAVILNAVKFDTDGETVLHQGTITGNSPIANEISWTADSVVDADGNEDASLYRNIPVISAYRLSDGDIQFTADNSTTLKSLKTTDGGVNVTSSGGSVTATSIQLASIGNLADVTLDAQNGGVTLGSVIGTAASVVSVTASQGIADDGNAATTAITANTINLTAAAGGVASDIGSSTNRLTINSVAAGDTITLTALKALGAIDASNVFVTSSASLTLNANAVDSIDIQATGAASDVEVQTVTASDEAGQITLAAGRDLKVGNVQVANGAFGTGSKISLTAGRLLQNASNDPTDTVIEANALSLSAGTFDGSFKVSNVDNVARLSAKATAANGAVNLEFDRATALTLDGVSTVGGNIGIRNLDGGDFLIGSGGITAGTASSSNTVSLVSVGGGIGKPTDPSEQQGTIFAGAQVSLSASNDIDALTKAGQLTATSATGSIGISQTGNVKISAGGLTANAGTVKLAVTGGAIQSGPGLISATAATVSADNGINIKTSVDSLSATATSGDVTILESDGLNVGTGGIKATGGAVSLTLTKGTLTGGIPAVIGNSVALKLLEAGQTIAIDTSASSLTASTVDGSITIRNDKNFSIGATGIVAGAGASDVTLSVKGSITNPTGSGKITANNLSLSATTGIAANTSASTLTAVSSLGTISLVQSGKAVTLESIIASNGGVTVTNNNDLAVTSVQAIGSGRNVSLTATGTNKKITIGANSIAADGDLVTLTSTGGIDGTSQASDPDIKAGTVTLTSSGGDVTATLLATTVTASALGTDADTGVASDLDITLLGTKSMFVGTTGGINLTAAGNVSLATPNSGSLIVIKSPTAGVGKTTTYTTSGAVTYAVTSNASAGTGSLTQALTDAGAATIVGGGKAGVGFSTSITSPIQLTSTINVTSALSLDGTQRLNAATGTVTTGRQVNIDGSRLAIGTAGFKLSGAADNSSIRGFAFYGFNKAGGAAVELSPSADNVTIANNLFGISSTGTVSSNTFGILANGTVVTPLNNLAITGNTIVRSTDTGIKLGTNVTNAVVTGNLIGTNAARVSRGNAVGIDVSGAGVGNTIGGATAAAANVIAANTTAGIRVAGTDASAGSATTIRGNELLLNGTGILVNGASKNVTIAGNTITRNTADGISVNGTSRDVTIGGAVAADRNYIGTTVTKALGLGNARNGVSVSSSGFGITVQNNTILGNGTANVANDNTGVKLSGANTNATTVTGNTINANRGAGILAARTGVGVVSITKNAITSNTGSGVQVSTGTAVVGGTSTDSVATLRSNANTINSNGRSGVEVLAGAFAQVAGNSMASNRVVGIVNPGLAPSPMITTVTRSAASGLLTVNFSGLAAGQVVDVYAGTNQGRTYLGRFTATGTTGIFTMTLVEQQAAGVAGAVFVGAPITATRSSTTQTSAFAAVKAITRVA